jgi:hypothetical protein
VHSNWRDYTQDTSLFDDLRGVAQIHLVDEIDWLSPRWNSCWWRYSAMHARNILNVLRHARHEAFDRLLLIDHDVLFRGDLASAFMALGSDADLVVPRFDDRAVPKFIVTGHGIGGTWLPKAAVHHMLLSPRLVAAAAADESMVDPAWVEGDAASALLAPYGGGAGPVFADTFALMLHRCLHADLGAARIVRSSEAAPLAEHFFASSFNYGMLTRGPGYAEHIERIRGAAARALPGGWDAVRARMGLGPAGRRP